MSSGQYVFSQLVDFLPKRTFDGIVNKYQGNKYVKTFTCWNQLLVMMYCQPALELALKVASRFMDGARVFGTIFH